MTEQDKINNLSRFEHENDLLLKVGTQLGILTEDYDVVNCVVTRIDLFAKLESIYQPLNLTL